MWILFFVAAIVGGLCNILVNGALNDNGALSKEQKRMAIIAIMVEAVVGILLCWIVDFNIQFYEYNELDFYDYGDITPDGILYFCVKLLGAVEIVTAMICAGRVAISELKAALCCTTEKDVEQSKDVSMLKSIRSGNVEECLDILTGRKDTQ